MIPTYLDDLHQMPPPTFRFQHGMKIRIVDGAFFLTPRKNITFLHLPTSHLQPIKTEVKTDKSC